MTTSQSRDTRGGGGRPGTRRFSGRRRRQCVCKEVGTVGYKDVSVLRRFISDRGRIESGRKSGNCAKCQRELSTAIARARFLALLPYAPNHTRVTGSIAPASTAAASEEEEGAEETSEEAAAAEESSNEEETATASTEETADESEDTSDSVESSEEEESAEEAEENPAEDADDAAESEETEDSAEAEESEEENKE